MSDQTTATPLTVDGIALPREERPGTAQEVADLMATADREGTAVIPAGGGTKLALGNAPERAELGLRLGALNRVLHYEPTDMTLSVEAGARFADVQAVLAEHGQELPVEAPDSGEATIGGLIATAIAGPRRLGSGTLRDLLIGINVAYPSGIVAKAGGLVVKNVTGFDMMRLHLGALGTLGVIVSANFKVLPRPRTEATVLTAAGSLAEALAAAGRVRATRVQPVAVELMPSDGGWQAAFRLMGRADTVRMLGDEVVRTACGGSVLADEESRAFWQTIIASQGLRTGDSAALVRLTAKPAGTAALADAAISLANRSAFAPSDWLIGPGLGSVTCRLSGPTAGDSAAMLADWQRQALAIAENVTVLAAPVAWKREIDVWGREAEPAGVMRAVKQEFDPNRVLNPGRFAGRL